MTLSQWASLLKHNADGKKLDTTKSKENNEKENAGEKNWKMRMEKILKKVRC